MITMMITIMMIVTIREDDHDEDEYGFVMLFVFLGGVIIFVYIWFSWWLLV